MKRPSLQSILQVDNSYHSKFQYIRMLYDSNYSNTTICKNRITGEIIVLKENMNQKYFYQLQREIMHIRKLNHDGIISVKDFHINEDLNKCYTVLPYFKNGDLFDFYEKNPSFFTIGRILEIIRKLCSIVKYCHENNICHRDIKLENILLNDDFLETMSITLIDFGLSVEKYGDEFIMDEVCGSPNYMAPEILSYDQSYYSEQCDVWSIGIILYFFVYKKFPFDYDDVESLRYKINTIEIEYPSSSIATPELVDLLQNLLCKDPTKRITLEDALSHKCFSYAI